MMNEVLDNSDMLANRSAEHDGRDVSNSIGSIESIHSARYNNRGSTVPSTAGLCGVGVVDNCSHANRPVSLSPPPSSVLKPLQATMDFSIPSRRQHPQQHHETPYVPLNETFASHRQISGPVGQTSTHSRHNALDVSDCCGSCTNTNRLGSIEIAAIRPSVIGAADQAIGNDNQILKSLVKRAAPLTLGSEKRSHSRLNCDKHNKHHKHRHDTFDSQEPVDTTSYTLPLLTNDCNSFYEPASILTHNKHRNSPQTAAVNTVLDDCCCYCLDDSDNNDDQNDDEIADSRHDNTHQFDIFSEPNPLTYRNGFNMPAYPEQKAQSEAPTPTNNSTGGESVPNGSKNEFKTKSTLDLNSSVNPVAFFEGYRNRNSSQRPLVAEESFSTASTLSVHTGITEPASVASEGGLIMQNGGDDHFKDGRKSLPIDSRSSTESLPERGQWSGQLDFIFSCISYAVGLGNVWRFPYLCYKNGGGAFLIPYLICVFTLGIPLFLMEVGLGQFTSSGGISIWNKIPIMKGVGYASMVMIGLCNTYYIIIISWTLYYLFNSFMKELPWATCGHEWNNEFCHGANNDTTDVETPSAQFWKNQVLNMSDHFGEIGGIQIHLLITLTVAWILVYFVIYKGIHQSGKIIWFSAMFPYVILTILFSYGLSLVGSGQGISYYLTPDWERLKEADIWIAAGTQLLFTYGIGIGTNIALGSYNTFHHNFFRDSLIACLLSSCTSLFSGFVIFSVLGHLAHELGVDVSTVVDEGPGLTFVVYPEAVARLPVPNLWAVLFFVMLLILGIDSQFCTVESFVTGLVDEFPRFLRPRRQMFTTFVVFVHFILGFTMITRGGMYIFQLMDSFSASGVSLLVVVLCEVMGFCWIYGGDKIYSHMETMLKFKPPRIFYYLWVFVAPFILVAILIFSIVRYSPPEMRKGEPFPWEGQLLGWIISAASMICIPIYFVYYIFFKSDSSLTIKERLIIGFSDPSDSSVNFESNSNLEESFNCDLEKCSGIDLLNNIRDPNQAHIIGKPAPV